MFQSLTGRLKTADALGVSVDYLLFQSLTGRLKTMIIPTTIACRNWFQSLTGRLKTPGKFMMPVLDAIVSIPHR